MSYRSNGNWRRERQPGMFDNYRQAILFLGAVVLGAGIGAFILVGLVLLFLALIGVV